ncbi:hypothetical protein MMC24_006777 [Lignoscripta atroalba]|nr:hypothetical protein [Lignoscripta atroalba]
MLLTTIFLCYICASANAQRPEDLALARQANLDSLQHQRLLNKPDIGRTTGRTSPHGIPSYVGNQKAEVPLVQFDTFSAILDALDVMQSHFFEIWQGAWPAASDWTSAVMCTQVSTTLSAISMSGHLKAASKVISNSVTHTKQAKHRENLINRYFTHTTSFYFGENSFTLRGQAYDDMLWVVLEWLESIRFIKSHSRLHYESSSALGDHSSASTWYGRQFIPPFAHRARLFWDLASHGWDTSLCGGGMIWSPYLAPYKNAITNQLYITASVSMYLYFPGDTNSSPFSAEDDEGRRAEVPPARAHDPKYLRAAVEAYRWLTTSNMTNEKGLFVDGFHIRGWRGGGPNGSIGSGQCDVRDEMVYTYNQGVLLSGLRGLWESTGTSDYLEDGHRLIRNVITATGWHIQDAVERRKWAGIGRNGILEEACDASATCSQDGQTFKGIFFHHMTLFCAPLPIGLKHGIHWKADPALASLHRQSCRRYGPWIKHNAAAAYRTRNEEGEFGMWWGDGLHREHESDHDNGDMEYNIPDAATDYRNNGVPEDDIWRLPDDLGVLHPRAVQSLAPNQIVVPAAEHHPTKDRNDRGRGRTVETQSGGLALLRAAWRLVDVYA